MPWYFYGRYGIPVKPKQAGTIAVGSIVPSFLPYTAPAPDGYLFCDGQSVLKNDYLSLFALIGTTFGSASINHFNLPNLKGKFARGITNSAAGFGDQTVSGATPVSGGGSGGTKTHSHTFGGHSHTYSLPAHTHTIDAHTHTISHVHNTNNHRHEGATYNLSTATSSYSIDASPNHQDSSKASHNHNNIKGFTDTTNPGNSGGSSGANTGGATSNLTDSASVSALTSSSADELSSSVTQFPPYLTMSFLVKI